MSRARAAARFAATAVLLPPLLPGAVGPAAAAVPPPPPNDHIAEAIVVPGLPFSDSEDTTSATTDRTDPTECFGNAETVWYRFTPDATGDVQADTFDSDYDTTLSVWVGRADALELVACNDDYRSLQSRVRFTATSGTPYWIMVGSLVPSDEPRSLVFSMAALPPPIDLRVSIKSTGTLHDAGVATVRGSVSCSRPVDLVVVGSVRQGWRRPPAVGWFSLSVGCSGFARWTATTPGETNSFAPGGARVGLSASGVDEAREEPTRRFAAHAVTLSRP